MNKFMITEDPQTHECIIRHIANNEYVTDDQGMPRIFKGFWTAVQWLRNHTI